MAEGDQVVCILALGSDTVENGRLPGLVASISRGFQGEIFVLARDGARIAPLPRASVAHAAPGEAVFLALAQAVARPRKVLIIESGPFTLIGGVTHLFKIRAPAGVFYDPDAPPWGRTGRSSFSHEYAALGGAPVGGRVLNWVAAERVREGRPPAAPLLLDANVAFVQKVSALAALCAARGHGTDLDESTAYRSLVVHALGQEWANIHQDHMPPRDSVRVRQPGLSVPTWAPAAAADRGGRQRAALAVAGEACVLFADNPWRQALAHLLAEVALTAADGLYKSRFDVESALYALEDLCEGESAEPGLDVEWPIYSGFAWPPGAAAETAQALWDIAVSGVAELVRPDRDALQAPSWFAHLREALGDDPLTLMDDITVGEVSLVERWVAWCALTRRVGESRIEPGAPARRYIRDTPPPLRAGSKYVELGLLEVFDPSKWGASGPVGYELVKNTAQAASSQAAELSDTPLTAPPDNLAAAPEQVSQRDRRVRFEEDDDVLYQPRPVPQHWARPVPQHWAGTRPETITGLKPD